MRASTWVGMRGGLLVAVLIAVSGRCEAQQPGAQDSADPQAAQEDCRSVVMVRCAQPPPQEAPRAAAPANTRQTTRQRLDARRLRQIQAEAGLTTVEITGERPQNPEPDPWEDFRQSVAGAAVPNCFAPEAQPRQQFAVSGLLRLPLLVHAALVGKCR